MAFFTGVLFIDAPASALNNAGNSGDAATDNVVAVKAIKTRNNDVYPYVSAQAFRYWLRSTLEQMPGSEWKSAPIFREKKIAYTDANPLLWWDDDLFGYMRAEGTKKEAVTSRAGRGTQTPTATTITRVSPFRVSTLVSIAPVRLTSDFGTMSRHEGDPVPHEHQFYRTVLKGLFSLDLHSAGTFSYQDRTGYMNLDSNRQDMAAADSQIEHLQAIKSYRLPLDERVRRISALVNGLAELSGGAKQSIHYTDVTPAIVIAAVIEGGNNPLQYVIGADAKGLPVIKSAALREMVKVWGDKLLSPLYIGWVEGFQDEQRKDLQFLLDELSNGDGPRLPFGAVLDHPRPVLNQLANSLASKAEWLD